ncbi:MAG: pilus assembly protein [Kangiellaceae bacterium]|nr:pilus assembly protein [Kangiellaceae bacterium]
MKVNHLGSRQSGQSAFEMVLVLPVLLILIFGIIQWGFISRTKITMNTATELAARAGALNNGQQSEIRSAFSRGMVPLFMQAQTGEIALVRALARATLAVRVRSQLTILNPSTEVWNEFRTTVIYPNQRIEVDEIINDNLMFRPSTQQSIGDGVLMNIQDANLLKIQMDWCEELIVPVIGSLIVEAASGLFSTSAQQRRCNVIGFALNAPYLAMRSTATYRMQTPFRNR